MWISCEADEATGNRRIIGIAACQPVKGQGETEDIWVECRDNLSTSGGWSLGEGTEIVHG